MKRYLSAGLLVLLTGVWLFFTTRGNSGINSIANLANLNSGILASHLLPAGGMEQLPVHGVNAQLDIDSLGIPHIFADDLHSLAYAVGYVHARDRYFQMELLAYTVMGRLSEIVGTAGIASDERWKVFGLEEKARQYFDSLHHTTPALYDYLQAYADGVNGYVNAEVSGARDPLYTIWGRTPGHWDGSYALLVQWYLSSKLTLYDDYFNRQEVLDKLPDTIRQMLYPMQSPDLPAIVPGSLKLAGTVPGPAPVQLFAQQQSNRYVAQPFDPSLGSNNWVVGGSRTTAGELYLCNDLHLSLVAPNIMYEMHLKGPNLHAYGYTVPGVPLVLTGHNDKIAWGITNGGWDVTEQYLLKQDTAHPGQYWLNGKWEPVREVAYEVKVKDEDPYHFTAHYTVFGPSREQDGIAYALRWHPATSCNAVEALWKVMQAADWNGFREALRHYDYPSQNFVYGDTGGNIGIICAGKMPLKPQGYNGGLLDGTHAPLQGYIPFDSLPQAYNPPQGYLFSANQQPSQERYYYSSRWFDDLYRPRRIRQMLASGQHIDKPFLQQMQLDVKDLSAEDLQRILHKYAAGEKLSARWETLRNWDGVLTPHNEAATFFKIFRWAIRTTGEEMAAGLGVKASPGYDQLLNFLIRYDSLSFNGKTFHTAALFHRIVQRTDSTYEAFQRNDPGEMAKAYAFDIPQLTELPGMNIGIDNIGGSENTINVNYTAHPVIRTLVQLDSSGVRSWMVNAIGQTGRFNEPDYTRQLEAWIKNELHLTQFVTTPDKLQAIQKKYIFVNLPKPNEHVNR